MNLHLPYSKIYDTGQIIYSVQQTCMHSKMKRYHVWITSGCVFSVCVCHFASKGLEERFVLVGTASDMILNPRSCSGGHIHTYRLLTMADGGQKLELLHTVRKPVCQGTDLDTPSRGCQKMKLLRQEVVRDRK